MVHLRELAHLTVLMFAVWDFNKYYSTLNITLANQFTTSSLFLKPPFTTEDATRY